MLSKLFVALIVRMSLGLPECEDIDSLKDFKGDITNRSLDALGEGTYGKVYKVKNPKNDKFVAAKVIQITKRKEYKSPMPAK
jgi:hypothetical protein